MDIAPMNKTQIIQFGMVELLCKLWNMSRKMRRRVRWILETRCIYSRKYDIKLFIFNNWFVWMRKAYFNSSCTQMMKHEFNAKHYINTLDLKGKECNLNTILEKSNDSIKFINYLEIIKYPMSKQEQRRYETIHTLVFNQVYPNQIRQFLKKVKTINTLFISNSFLSDLDLTNKGIKHLYIEDTSINYNFKFPSSLKTIYISDCTENYLFKKCNIKSDIFCLSDKLYGRGIRFNGYVRSSKLVSNLTGFRSSNKCCCPPESMSDKEVISKFLDFKNNNCLYFIALETEVPIKIAQKFKMRYFNPFFPEEEGTYTVRPRGLKITCRNYKDLEKHPELFEKVSNLTIRCETFKLDCLSERIKNIRVEWIDIDSSKLNRFEGECLEVQKHEVQRFRYFLR